MQNTYLPSNRGGGWFKGFIFRTGLYNSLPIQSFCFQISRKCTNLLIFTFYGLGILEDSPETLSAGKLCCKRIKDILIRQSMIIEVLMKIEEKKMLKVVLLFFTFSFDLLTLFLWNTFTALPHTVLTVFWLQRFFMVKPCPKDLKCDVEVCFCSDLWYDKILLICWIMLCLG